MRLPDGCLYRFTWNFAIFTELDRLVFDEAERARGHSHCQETEVVLDIHLRLGWKEGRKLTQVSASEGLLGPCAKKLPTISFPPAAEIHDRFGEKVGN